MREKAVPARIRKKERKKERKRAKKEGGKKSGRRGSRVEMREKNEKVCIIKEEGKKG